MPRIVEANPGERGVVLPDGWVLDGGDSVVISDVSWAEILEDVETLGRLQDLGSTAAAPDEVPTWRDIQQTMLDVVGGTVGEVTQAEFDAHTGDTTGVHGIADTSVLETTSGATAKVNAHATRTDNPHSVTKAQVGLANAENTTDLNKPISTATLAALGAKADLVGGLVPTSQIPAIAITDTFPVASQAAMLALTAQKGDVAVRSDVAKAFILATNSPSTLADWIELPSAAGSVTSVNGQTGVVVLAKGDIGLGNVTNTSDANKPVSTAQQTALDLKANIASPTFTGTVSGITKSMVGLGNVNNTADIDKPISDDTQMALDLKADLIGGYVHYDQLPPDIGTGGSGGGGIIEDPDDPGFYIIFGGMIEDPSDPGFYLIGA